MFRALYLPIGIIVSLGCTGTAVAETTKSSENAYNASRDIAANDVKYYIGGRPSAHTELFISLLKNKYNITAVQLGCTPGRQEAEEASRYNEDVVSVLRKKFGNDFIAKAEHQAKNQFQERKEP